MSINPLDEFAPYPKSRNKEASPEERDKELADAVAKHLTVDGFLAGLSANLLARKAFRRGATDADSRAYLDAVDRLNDKFAAVFLLRALGEYAPDKVNEVVSHLWECWQQGGVMPDLLCDWLEPWGIDPDDVSERVAMRELGAA
jgi:hypothetical protein